MTWAESLDANYTDGIVVLHRGRIVYERYFGALDARTPAHRVLGDQVVRRHARAILIDEGVLDESATVALSARAARSGFGDATLRQLLDMTTASTTPRTTPTRTRRCGISAAPAASCRARPANAARQTFYGYLRIVSPKAAHGERFAYKTPNTDVARLGAAPRHRQAARANCCTSGSGSKLGVEQDAYFTRRSDRRRVRRRRSEPDPARPGALRRDDAPRRPFNGQQIVPSGSSTISAAAAIAILCARRLRDAAGLELSHDVVGVAQRAWRLFRARHSRAGDLRRSDRRDGDRALRLAPAGGNANLDPTSLPAYHAIANI